MRQGQSQQRKNRSRSRGGRNSNKGGGGNQINRNMESNGPDVRIRGTPSHIAEKYTSLARDSHAAGDMVAEENYLQHAEHYNRMIAAALSAQAAQMALREVSRNDENRHMAASDGESDAAANSDQSSEIENSVSEPVAIPIEGEGPQPTLDGILAEVALNPQTINGQVEENSKGDTLAEQPRRKRRVPRRPRKEASDNASEATSGPDLPAFIVGAGDS